MTIEQRVRAIAVSLTVLFATGVAAQDKSKVLDVTKLPGSAPAPSFVKQGGTFIWGQGADVGDQGGNTAGPPDNASSGSTPAREDARTSRFATRALVSVLERVSAVSNRARRAPAAHRDRKTASPNRKPRTPEAPHTKFASRSHCSGPHAREARGLEAGGCTGARGVVAAALEVSYLSAASITSRQRRIFSTRRAGGAFVS